MTAFAALVLADRTPTNVTFNPTGIDSLGVAKWMDSNAVYDGKRVATMSTTLPKPGGQVARCKQKVAIPHLDPVSGVKLGESYVTVEYVVSKLASANDRLDLQAFAKNFPSNAVTTAFVTAFEAIY